MGKEQWEKRTMGEEQWEKNNGGMRTMGKEQWKSVHFGENNGRIRTMVLLNYLGKSRY
jgi:hypothetical protein